MTLLGRVPRGPVIVAAILIVVDQLTKHWALNALDHGKTIDLIWTLRFNLAFNTGMAFSLGGGLGPYIGAIALVVVVGILLSLGQSKRPWNVAAVGLVLGGAIGNLIDRAFRGDAWLHGAVVDFIDLQWFPIFNIADIGVTVGGIMLVLGYLWESRTAEQDADAG